MKYTFYWRIFLETKDKNKINDVLNDLSYRLNKNINVLFSDDYYKIKELYEITFESIYEFDSVSEALLDIFEIIYLISSEWVINSYYNNGNIFSLEGIQSSSDRFYMKEIKWANFTFSNEEVISY